MRGTSQRDHLTQQEVRRWRLLLPDEGHEPGTLHGGVVGDGGAVEQDVAGIELAHPGDGSQQSRLADSVDADDGGELPRLGGETHVVDDDAVVDAALDIANFETCHDSLENRYWLRPMRYRKMGAPMNPVTTPSGTSCGAAMTRAPTSTHSRKRLPMAAATGTIDR